jgi:hypothetical protein
MISTKQYTDTYNQYTEMLRKYAENISKSSSCRATMIINAETADVLDLLQEAVDCIYDMTGDECFLKQLTEAIERRRDAT